VAELSVRGCAASVGVSVGYLNEAVKRATGFTPGHLVRQAQAREAKRLLAATDLTVRQVARLAGFSDPAYFGRFFRRETGSSPGDFRRGIRADHHDRRILSIGCPGTPEQRHRRPAERRHRAGTDAGFTTPLPRPRSRDAVTEQDKSAPEESAPDESAQPQEKSGIRRKSVLKAALVAAPLPLLVGAAAPVLARDLAWQGRALPPTPEACDPGDPPAMRQTEGPYFKPDSPRRTCQPIPNALLDFWQADVNGAYDNTGYRFRGHQYSDAQGGFSLQTIVAGLYPGRTRHIPVRCRRRTTRS
jgi:AraC-like DNA-binding protein